MASRLRLYENISPGLWLYRDRGLRWLAGLHPLGVVASRDCLWCTLEVGANALQRDANVPATLAAVIEAAVILSHRRSAMSQTRMATRETGKETKEQRHLIEQLEHLQ